MFRIKRLLLTVPAMFHRKEEDPSALDGIDETCSDIRYVTSCSPDIDCIAFDDEEDGYDDWDDDDD